MSGPIRTTLSILGTIGNILALIVFTRPSMGKTETNYILIGKKFEISNVLWVVNFNIDTVECLSIISVFQLLHPLTWSL